MIHLCGFTLIVMGFEWEIKQTKLCSKQKNNRMKQIGDVNEA